MEYLVEISFIILLLVVFLFYYYHEKDGIPTNWPIVGMVPALLVNLHHINQYVVDTFEKTHLNFVCEGPSITGLRALGTVDPANVHHILSKNFVNYHKGSNFQDIFDVLGDGIFNADSPLWEYHRKMTHSFLTHLKFHETLVQKVEEKIESGLKPVLDHVCDQRIEIDLQDLFGRFTFDVICSILMNIDPKSLSIELPSVPVFKALDDTQKVIFYRHIMPPPIWKLLRWLNVGLEKKNTQSCKILDDFMYKCIATKRSQNINNNNNHNFENNDNKFNDLLTLYLMEENEKSNNNKFLRDTILSLMIAGRDTTTTTLSWFFYLLSKNPKVETKLREELKTTMNNKTQNFSKHSRELCTKMVYLHAALCETLRLYPPVVLEKKSPIEADTLPSGHKVNPNSQIFINLFAMGRMKSIWGDDSWEFKPERWITEQGKVRHEPSYKFLAFNAGPRTCLGKDMAFTQMKIVVANILRNYRIEAVEGFDVVHDLSIILHMKYGFRVKVCRLS